jgi:hypothetical protein
VSPSRLIWHGPDRQAGKAIGDLRIEALSVGLDLELDARLSERFGEGEKMRHDQRLAATEHHVEHAALDDLVSELQRLAASSSSASRFQAPNRCSNADSRDRSRA